MLYHFNRARTFALTVLMMLFSILIPIWRSLFWYACSIFWALFGQIVLRTLRKADDWWQVVLDNLSGNGPYQYTRFSPPIPQVILQTADGVHAALAPLVDDPPPFLAVDYEADPAQPNQTDLAQICTGQVTFIIRLASMGMNHGNLPPILEQILCNPVTLKISNNAQCDAMRLNKSYELATIPRCADLSLMAIHVDPRAWPMTVSDRDYARNPRFWFRRPAFHFSNTRTLQRLAYAYTGFALAKEETLANWSGELTPEMLDYATNDVDATWRVFDALHRRNNFAEVDPNKYTFDLIEGESKFVGTTVKWRASPVS